MLGRRADCLVEFALHIRPHLAFEPLDAALLDTERFRKRVVDVRQHRLLDRRDLHLEADRLAGQLTGTVVGWKV